MWNEAQAVETSAVAVKRVANVAAAQSSDFHLDELVDAVNRLSHEDYLKLSQRLQRTLPEPATPAATQKPARSVFRSLTRRESEVLTLVASGYSRKEIGQALSISENTAACHIASIYRKLEISTIAEATRVAIQSGVI